MNHVVFSRIDRAVADKIKDIQRSFGDQSGIVQDFIVFISKQLKLDLLYRISVCILEETGNTWLLSIQIFRKV